MGQWRNRENGAIDREMTADPSLTKTDAKTGKVEIYPGGVTSTVESYPGLDSANPGEVEAKVGKNKVKVRMPDGSVKIRKAVKGDSVPGKRQTKPPKHTVKAKEWCC